MKSFIPALSLAILFASCTTAYKSGQTPDDVYYSPERPQDEYVYIEKEDDRRYQEENAYRDDRFLRMKVYDRRWSALDGDFYYSYRPYHPGSYYYYNNTPWNSYTYWNHFYNPYYGNVIVVNPKRPVYNAPRSYNLDIFNNPGNSTSTNNNKGVRRNSNTTRKSSNSGNILRDVFGSGSNSSNAGKPATRSSNPSGSGSSGSSGSSGGSKAPVRKF